MKWVEESLWWFRSAAVEVLVPQPPPSIQRTKVEGREVVLGAEAALVVDSRMAVVEHNPCSLGKPAADTLMTDTLVADKPGCCSKLPKLPGLGPSTKNSTDASRRSALGTSGHAKLLVPRDLARTLPCSHNAGGARAHPQSTGATTTMDGGVADTTKGGWHVGGGQRTAPRQGGVLAARWSPAAR